MLVLASPQIARLAGLVRLALLTLVAVHLAHDAVYVVHFGTGHELESAMGERGHDAYWPTFTLIGIAAGVGLAAFWAIRVAVLSRAAGRSDHGVAAWQRPVAAGGSGYVAELARLWAGLWALVIPLYLVLENVEGFLVGGRLLGFEPLAGGETRLAVPVIALLTLALAAVGALVRWRIQVLEARIARGAARPSWEPAPARAPAVEWGPVGLLAAHRWIAGRLDAGRAPPALSR